MGLLEISITPLKSEDFYQLTLEDDLTINPSTIEF